MTNSLPRSNPGWGKKLVEALTRDQVETLLDVLVGAGDPLRLPGRTAHFGLRSRRYGAKARG